MFKTIPFEEAYKTSREYADRLIRMEETGENETPEYKELEKEFADYQGKFSEDELSVILRKFLEEGGENK